MSVPVIHTVKRPTDAADINVPQHCLASSRSRLLCGPAEQSAASAGATDGGAAGLPGGGHRLPGGGQRKNEVKIQQAPTGSGKLGRLVSRLGAER